MDRRLIPQADREETAVQYKRESMICTVAIKPETSAPRENIETGPQ